MLSSASKIATSPSSTTGAPSSVKETVPPRVSAASKAVSGEPSASYRATTSPATLPSWFEANPVTTILPSGCSATAKASLSSTPRGVATLPPVPKPGSSAPSAPKRQSASSAPRPSSPANPATTILPSGCTRTSRPPPVGTVTRPAVPNPASSVPSAW